MCICFYLLPALILNLNHIKGRNFIYLFFRPVNFFIFDCSLKPNIPQKGNNRYNELILSRL